MKRLSLSCRACWSLASAPAAAALLGLASSFPLAAADRFWIDAAGGNFHSNTNWSASPGGARGATVPVAADDAWFTLNSTYNVAIITPVINDSLSLEIGNITFDISPGNSYTLTNNGNTINVGNVSGQTARLTVVFGTLGVDGLGDNVAIGLNGGTGFLTVTRGGLLGSPTVRPDVFVGSSGTGTLTVNETGRVNGWGLIAGNSLSSSGTVTVTGPSAVAAFDSLTSIGYLGNGTLSVLAGAAFVSATTTLAHNLGVDGTATVSGAGSSWTINGDINTGNSGDGLLTISAGGVVTNSGIAQMGTSATGVGTVTVTGAGSLWRPASTSSIGVSGLGILNITAGGRVENGLAATLGINAGSEGRVTVSGAGSQWLVSNPVTIGQGEMMVSAGGFAAATSLGIANNASGTGEVTVTGAGSLLRIGTTVNIGPQGNGTLNVLSGGTLWTGTNVTTNDPAGTPVGTLRIDGGMAYIGGDFINNGYFIFDDGLLQVTGDFQVASAPVNLVLDGFEPDDVPVIDLIGSAGTTVNLLGMIIGNGHHGKLMLRHSRLVTTSGNVAVGSAAGGEGTLSVESGARLAVPAAALSVGGNSGIIGGTGTLDIAGGTVDAGTLRNYATGTVNLSSGFLAVDSVAIMDGAFNWTGGTLRFDANTVLTNTLAPKLFGPVPTLHSGQTLATAGGIGLTLQTPLVLDGGVINAATLLNQSRLELRSGSVGTLQNDGLLLGDGLITGSVTNNAAGRIHADAGKTLTFTGTFAPNAGQISLQGGNMWFSAAITNTATGFISGRGGLFTGGITNNGQMAFSGGNMDIFGDVTLTAGSRVATSSAGSATTFWDDVTHNGTEIFTGAGCSTVFFGALTGSGSYTGSGTIYFIGDLRPGSSPGIVTCAPQAVFSPSSGVTLEIGGLTPGTQHDKLVFTSAATPQVEWSGSLTVTLINGFTPAAGDAFDVFDFDAARDAGTFSSVTVVDHGLLPPGLAFNFDDLYTTGIIRVVSTTGGTFAQWAATELGDPGALPGGDHNNNGYDNLTEYALALHPPFPGAAAPSGGFHVYPEGERMRVLFWRHIDRTDVTLRVQASNNLVTWSDLALSVNSAPFTGAGFVSENRAHPLSEPGLVEVRDILNASGEARRYLRILVTLSP